MDFSAGTAADGVSAFGQRCYFCPDLFQADSEPPEDQQADDPEGDCENKEHDNGKTACQGFVDSKERESDYREKLVGSHIGRSAWNCSADVNNQKYGGAMPE